MGAQFAINVPDSDYGRKNKGLTGFVPCQAFGLSGTLFWRIQAYLSEFKASGYFSRYSSIWNLRDGNPSQQSWT